MVVSHFCMLQACFSENSGGNSKRRKALLNSIRLAQRSRGERHLWRDERLWGGRDNSNKMLSLVLDQETALHFWVMLNFILLHVEQNMKNS